MLGLLFVVALLTFFVGVSVTGIWKIEPQPINVPAQVIWLPDIESRGRIHALISCLSSNYEEVRARAEKELIRLGRESPEQRKRVIEMLMHEVPEDLKSGRHLVLCSTFDYWRSVTNVFGELRATEATDLLIRTIHYGNALSGSMHEAPSSRALVKIGTVALPQLSDALRHESKPGLDSI